MRDFLTDLAQALRTLRRAPLFTTVAVLTLALGIGATASLFSVVNGVILRPLSLPEPDRLVLATAEFPPRGWTGATLTGPEFAAWRERSRTLESVAAFTTRNVELTGRGDPDEVVATIVSGEYFTVLPMTPLAGRTFTAEEMRDDRADLVLLGEGVWRRLFGGDPAVVGTAVTVNGTPRTIIGVIPATAAWPRGTDVVFAFPDRFAQLDVDFHLIQVIGRRRPAATTAEVQTELNTLSAAIDAQRPASSRGWRVVVESINDVVLGSTRGPLLMLMGAVVFVLLLVCANVAGLQVARATARSHETAVRHALGASRWRLVRHLLAENVWLAGLGGLLAVLLAFWGVDLIRALAPDAVPRMNEVRVDGAVLGFTGLVAGLAVLLCGLAPAAIGSRADVHSMLKESGRGAGSRRAPLIRAVLVIGEMALAVVLIAGAGLMLRSFSNLRAIPLGFDPRNVVDVDLDLPASRYGAPEARTRFVHAAEERLRALPGVVSVGSTRALPLESGGPDTDVQVEGRPRPSDGKREWAFMTAVTPGYFDTMGMRLARGRSLAAADDAAGAALVAVVNETMARRFWPEEDPVGARVTLGTGRSAEVIGVVADVRQRSLVNDVEPQIFVPFSQAPETQVSLVVRTSIPAETLLPSVRREVWAVDPSLPVEHWTMEELFGDALASSRFQARLLSGFAIAALLIAVLGIYAVVSHMVMLRTREVGVRMALGAESRHVVRMVVGEGALLTGTGCALGLLGALGLSGVLRELLFEVRPADPWTLSGAAVLLAVAATVATWLPARRAANVDPTVALRAE